MDYYFSINNSSIDVSRISEIRFIKICDNNYVNENEYIAEGNFTIKANAPIVEYIPINYYVEQKIYTTFDKIILYMEFGI